MHLKVQLVVLILFALLSQQQLVHGGTAGVLELDEINFNKIVDGSKHVLVQFYEFSWKEIPDFDKVGKHFANNKEILITKVSTTTNKALTEKYGVKETPAVIFFTKGDSNHYDQYKGRQTFGDVIDFVSFSTNSDLNELKEIAEGFRQSEDQNKDLERIRELVVQLPPEYSDVGKYYLVTLVHVQQGGDPYIAKEKERLERLSAGKSVKPEKAAEFQTRLRILNALVSQPNA